MRRNRIIDHIQRATWSTTRRRAVTLAAAIAAAGALAAVLTLQFAGGGAGPRVAAAPTATPTAGASWEPLDVPPTDDRFTLEATSEDDAGVKVDTAFTFTSTESISESALAKRLTTQPELSLDLQHVSDREVRIVPRDPLRAGQIYRFNLSAEDGGEPLRSWAFQATSPLRVVETLPRDGATDVPLNTGIEMTFSHDGVTGYDARISIDPPVEGRFERHKRVVVFVPKQLQPETLYTVTVHAGVALEGSDLTTQEDRVFRFETATANTSPPPTMLQFSRRTFEMPTGQPPILALFTSDSSTNVTASFKVYRFPGVDGFVDTLHQLDAVPVWTRFARRRFLVDTSALPQVASFQAELQKIGRYGDLYVRFPEPLPEGFYLVQAESGGTSVQGWLQITDIATYTSVSATRSLVWANDLRTKAPLAGASLALTDGTQISATTDAQGVAYFDTPPHLVDLKPSEFGYTTTHLVSDVIVRAPDGRVAVVPLENVFDNYRYFGFREYGYYGDPGLYWRFLFTDRHLYLPTDTVHFWGLVRPRDSATGEREITVRIAGGQYDYGYASQTVAETVLKTSPSGTFIGDLPLVDASPGYYQLSIFIDGTAVASSYVQVQDYVKPAYKIDVTTSRHAVIAGNTVDYHISAGFFDGSPLPGATLQYSGPASGEVVTDAAGNATVSLAPSGDQYGYGANQFSVVPKLAEEGEITGSAWVRVFPSALTLDSESDIVGGQARLTGTVYNIDLDRLNRADAVRYDDPRGAVAPGRTVSADVVEITYARDEVGETYDFISKRVQKLYNYREVARPLGAFTATSGADGAWTMTWPADAGKNYRATVTVSDDAGRRYTSVTYVYSRGAVSYSDSRVYLSDVTHPETRSPNPYGNYNQTYATGDQVTVALQQSSADLPSGDANRYLFYTGQNGLRGFAVQADARYSFTFDDADVPSINVMGVRFTGDTYQESSFPLGVRFNPGERELKITVEPDKERYAPGDDATLRVTTADRDGKPVAAEVNLSAVDEAVFRVEGPYDGADREILPALYTPVGSGILRTYASHFYPFENAAAERGGGGGPRVDFKDVALFDRVLTGSDGTASITFKLPDNLTSWRITALGVTDGLLAGSALKALPVGLPFFVDAAMNRDYLLKDRPSIRLRAFGMELGATEDVAFEVSSPSLGIDDPIRVTSRAFTPVDVPLPDLREGAHELLIKATAGERSDSIVRKINVVPSRLSRTEARFYELTPDVQIEGSADRATDVIFSDHNRGRYYPLLQRLTWTWGDRVDQMLARNLSQDLLQQYFGEESQQDAAEFRASLYQSPSGGIGLFPYADADLALSARLADVAPDRFGRQTLIAYFLKIVNDQKETRERTIIATYGLAALGEPVLPSVRALSRQTDLTWRERLYVGLAAAALGDEDTAGQAYRALLRDYGQRRGPWVRLNVGADEDDIIEGTSLLAVLAAGVGDDLAPGIFDYTSQNYTRDILVQLEQISFLRRALPRLAVEPARFEYHVDGQRREATLERGETVRLRLTPSQLQELAPRAIEGNVGISTFFLAPFDPASVTPDPAVSVRRRIEAVGGGPIEDGKLVKVTLDYAVGPQAVDGCYQVSDLVPSGLRPVTRFYQWDVGPGASFPYALQGQRISFCVGKYLPQYYQPVVYYARVVGKGVYLAEPAIIQSQKAPESINLTPSETIEIR